MDVISANAFWRLQNGIVASYSGLTEPIDCEAIVVGGGISGALLLDKLAGLGVDVVLLERFDVGAGSTSGSTGLLQYEIDKTLIELTDILGLQRAQQAYWSCHRAIDTLSRLASELQMGPSFVRKPSLYVASDERDRADLQREFRARKEAGIDVHYMEADEIESKFAFSRPGAILSEQAAEVDPYLLTHRLMKRAVARGARVFDRTKVNAFESTNGRVHVETESGVTLTARTLIFATGYEASRYLPKDIVQLHSSFAAVTKPVSDFTGWYRQCLIWETARPYSYVRTTGDSRIIIGGEDEPFRDPKLRDALIPEKTETLLRKLGEIFPQIPFEFAYSWAGTFGETEDGLPYIGTLTRYPSVYFSCGYGGNGITYSAIAAEIIADSINGKQHRDRELFSFERFDERKKN